MKILYFYDDWETVPTNRTVVSIDKKCVNINSEYRLRKSISQIEDEIESNYTDDWRIDPECGASLTIEEFEKVYQEMKKKDQ